MSIYMYSGTKTLHTSRFYCYVDSELLYVRSVRGEELCTGKGGYTTLVCFCPSTRPPVHDESGDGTGQPPNLWSLRRVGKVTRFLVSPTRDVTVLKRPEVDDRGVVSWMK